MGIGAWVQESINAVFESSALDQIILNGTQATVKMKALNVLVIEGLWHVIYHSGQMAKNFVQSAGKTFMARVVTIDGPNAWIRKVTVSKVRSIYKYI